MFSERVLLLRDCTLPLLLFSRYSLNRLCRVSHWSVCLFGLCRLIAWECTWKTYKSKMLHH